MHAIGIMIAILTILPALSERSPQESAVTANLNELAWMAGSWGGIKNGVEMEELWQAPKGNTMLGLHRDVAKGRTILFEFLRIEATADGITYWASPNGRPATPFKLIELKGKRAVFENASHDFPQRIIYWLGEDGALHAKIEGMIKNKPASEEWTWQRIPAGG